MADFKVKRAHQGDRDYKVGEIRSAIATDVAHLVPLTLEPIEKKQEPAVQNKMEPATQNKSKSHPQTSKE